MGSPTEVNALSGLKIKKIAAGAFHSLALSEFGDVYAWGWNKDGQLGVWGDFASSCFVDSESYPFPSLVNIYDRIGCPVMSNVIDIACGSRHSIIKMENNTIWGTGYNKYGQLGLSYKTYPNIKHFKKVLDTDSDTKIICGTWTTVLVKDY